MIVGTLQVKVHYPAPQSLKEKRFILQSVLSRFRNQYNAGICELDGMDQWQYSHLAIACVSRERKEAEKVLDQALEFLNREPELRVTDHQKELL